MIRLGLRPSSSGGMREPRRLLPPLPGTSEGLRLPTGVDSLMTSILGASGALISGSLGCDITEEKENHPIAQRLAQISMAIYVRQSP